MRIRIVCVVAGATLLFPLLTGCGESVEDGPPPIATLQSAPPASSSTVPRERPVIGPDDGKVEYDRYMAAYRKCLTDLGILVPDDHQEPQIRPEAREGAEKCQVLVPESWDERERRIDPMYVDRLRETAQCLQVRGHDVSVGGDPVSILYGDNTSANKAYDDLRDCQQQAFKERLKRYQH